MKKPSKRPPTAQEVLAQLRLPLAEALKQTLLETVISAGSLTAMEMLREQCGALCGPRYRHQEDRRAYRHGSCSGSLVLGDVA